MSVAFAQFSSAPLTIRHCCSFPGFQKTGPFGFAARGRTSRVVLARAVRSHEPRLRPLLHRLRSHYCRWENLASIFWYAIA